jgi:uncharacterized membrane protein AbrB (regulator of aidB expression)
MVLPRVLTATLPGASSVMAKMATDTNANEKTRKIMRRMRNLAIALPFML